MIEGLIDNVIYEKTYDALIIPQYTIPTIDISWFQCRPAGGERNCLPVRPSTDPLNSLSSFGIVGLVVDEQGGLEFFPVRTYCFY